MRGITGFIGLVLGLVAGTLGSNAYVNHHQDAKANKYPVVPFIIPPVAALGGAILGIRRPRRT